MHTNDPLSNCTLAPVGVEAISLAELESVEGGVVPGLVAIGATAFGIGFLTGLAVVGVVAGVVYLLS